MARIICHQRAICKCHREFSAIVVCLTIVATSTIVEEHFPAVSDANTGAGYHHVQVKVCIVRNLSLVLRACRNAREFVTVKHKILFYRHQSLRLCARVRRDRRVIKAKSTLLPLPFVTVHRPSENNVSPDAQNSQDLALEETGNLSR